MTAPPALDTAAHLARLDPASYALPPELAARLVSPALVIDLARVRRNVERVLAAIGDADRWRPHLKTTKTPELWRELVARGVGHFKCATVREVRHLAQLLEREAGGRGDVCLAYPIQGPGLAELGRLAREHPGLRLSVLSEDPAHAARVPEQLGVFVDVNPGMNRSGLGFERRETILAVARAAGERWRGVHHYEGHLHGADYDERRAAAFAGYDELLELCAELAAEGLVCEELVTSGTPGFRCALEYAPFAELSGTRHRVSPGTLVLHDARGWEQNPELELEPAAVLFARVVSHPTPTRVTCDAGSKSIAAEAGNPCALVVGRPELVAQSPSEEHLPFEVKADELPPLGTELYLVPRHVCPTVNLAEQALLVDAGRFVAAVPIAARAHDLFLED